MKIKDIKAREILDSKGDPTVEAEVILENGIKALGQVPSGASTGKNEALELRDNDPTVYKAKGVKKAVENIKGPIRELLAGQEVEDQKKIDELMCQADGTENKAKFGANAILGVSMACCRVSARSQRMPLYKYFGILSENKEFVLPQPLILVLEGGKHGAWSTDIQEYFVIPKKEAFEGFCQRLRVGSEIFHTLEKVLEEKGYAIGVGYEGAFCPKEMKSNEEAFGLMIEATEKAGYKIPDQVVLGIDMAASEFLNGEEYVLRSEESLRLKPNQWTEKIVGWTKKYPIWSIEDAYGEESWQDWTKLTAQIGRKVQIVGDDLLTTNVKRIQKAIEVKAVNSVLIKLNQIGTVTETLNAIKLADRAGFTTVISHRSGETNDDMIADMVVGTSSWQSKFGGPDRGERVAKYNRLLRIEEELRRHG